MSFNIDNYFSNEGNSQLSLEKYSKINGVRKPAKKFNANISAFRSYVPKEEEKEEMNQENQSQDGYDMK